MFWIHFGGGRVAVAQLVRASDLNCIQDAQMTCAGSSLGRAKQYKKLMSSIDLCFQLTCTTHDPAIRIYTTFSIFRWASLSNDDTKGLGRRLLNIRQKTNLFGRSPPNGSIEEMIDIYLPRNMQKLKLGQNICMSRTSKSWEWDDVLDLQVSLLQSKFNAHFTFCAYQTFLVQRLWCITEASLLL